MIPGERPGVPTEQSARRGKPGPKPRLLPYGVRTFTVRLPADLVERLDARALDNLRSRNAEIELMVRRCLATNQAQP